MKVCEAKLWKMKVDEVDEGKRYQLKEERINDSSRRTMEEIKGEGRQIRVHKDRHAKANEGL